MSDRLRIVYRSRKDATPQSETAVLANVYSFVRKCADEKKGGPATAPDAGKEIIERSGKGIIPE